MNTPILVIVSGPPGTGKTTLGRMIAAELKLPYIGKDDIKEILFETLGWSDREWSRKLGAATYEVLFHLIDVELAAGRSFMVESNFRPNEVGTRFAELKARYGFHPVQLQVQTRGDVLFERHFHRETSGDRHPGHAGGAGTSPGGIKELLAGKYEVLPIGGDVIEVDTTDFNALDIPTVVNRIRQAVSANSKELDGTSG